MEREAFRLRMKQYKQARELNPLLKYWDWKKYSTGTDGINEYNPHITAEGYDSKGYYALATNPLPEITIIGNRNYNKDERPVQGYAILGEDPVFYLIYNPGAGYTETVSPEFDVLAGVGALKSTVSNIKILAKELNKNINKTTINTRFPNNIGWGPKLSIKVIHDSNQNVPLDLYNHARWDVVHEDANPHGIWFLGKFGNPRMKTNTSIPEKVKKAVDARKLFKERPYRHEGILTLNKPLATVGDVPDRSFVSNFADKIGADGIVYNDVYDNGYINNQVILSFKHPDNYNIIKKYQTGGITDDGTPGEASMQQIEAKHWLTNWFRNRTKQMAENIAEYDKQQYYGSSRTRALVSPWFWQDKEKNAKKVIEERIIGQILNTPVFDYREPWVANDKNALNRKEFLSLSPDIQGAYFKNYPERNAISISPLVNGPGTVLHELTHASQNGYDIQTSKVNDILNKHRNENAKKDRYLDKPEEVYAREMEFRYFNNILPGDTITKEQIEKWKNDGSVWDNDFLRRYSTITVEELLNSVAMNYAEGGIVDEDPPQTTSERPIINFDPKGDPYNVQYGYNPGAGYMQNAFSLLDIPGIGDAASIYDTGEAIANKDWLGASLAALSVMPFVPNTTKNIRKYIPTVNRSSVTEQLNRILGITPNLSKLQKESDWNNLRNRSIERLYDKDVRDRAALIKADYGVDLPSTYDDVINQYENAYFTLPEADVVNLSDAKAKMDIQAEADRRYKLYGIKPKQSDFTMKVDNAVNPSLEITNHEMSHFNLYIHQGNPSWNKSDLSKITKQFENALRDLNPIAPEYTNYFKNWMELNSYGINMLDRLKEAGITPTKLNILNYLKSLPDTDAIKRAALQFKTLDDYIKWLQTMPLANNTSNTENIENYSLA